MPLVSIFIKIKALFALCSDSFTIHHTLTGFNRLLLALQALEGKTKIVTEHTGRYYEPLDTLRHNLIVLIDQTFLNVNIFFKSPVRDKDSQK